MATIHVQYRRVVQMRSYESQEIVLGVEEEVTTNKPVLVEAIGKLYKQLEAVGDKLLADALGKPDLPRPAGGR